MASTERLLREGLELTEIQRQLILGTLLGDGHIRVPDNGSHPLIKIAHSVKQKEYVVWKYDHLSSLCRMKPYEGTSELNDRTYGNCYFSTRSLPCLDEIYKLTVIDNKKTVTKSWVDAITHPIALAAWFMDDGTINQQKKKSGNSCTTDMRFALGNASDSECNTLSKFLNDVWDIPTKLCKLPPTKHGKYEGRIYSELRITRTENLMRFKDLIQPYIIPSMSYKTRLYRKNLQYPN